jgi:hypothetical protein
VPIFTPNSKGYTKVPLNCQIHSDAMTDGLWKKVELDGHVKNVWSPSKKVMDK